MARKQSDPPPPRAPSKKTPREKFNALSRAEKDALLEEARRKGFYATIINCLGHRRPDSQHEEELKDRTFAFPNQEGKSVSVSRPAETVIVRHWMYREAGIMVRLIAFDYMMSKKQGITVSISMRSENNRNEYDSVFYATGMPDRELRIDMYWPDKNGWERYFSVFASNNRPPAPQY